MSLLGKHEEIISMIPARKWQSISNQLQGSLTVAGLDALEAYLQELSDATDTDRFEMITEENYDEYRGNFGEKIEPGDPVYFDSVDCLAITRGGIQTWIQQSADDTERVKYELVAQAFDRYMAGHGLRWNAGIYEWESFQKE